MNYEHLPPEVVLRTKDFILDTIGVIAAGADRSGIREFVSTAREWGGVAESSILFHGDKLPAYSAAAVNAAMGHALDFDDGHEIARIHANAVIFPVALAVAEAIGGVNGREFISSVALGTDVACRLALGAKKYKGWHFTSVCGVFGACATAMRLLGLNKVKIRNGLGIAYSLCAGSMQVVEDGALAKRLHPGFAAMQGILAAYLASAEISGPSHPFTGEFGFYQLYEDGEIDIEKILYGLGDDYSVMGLSMKPYPCCRLTHACIDAALAIKQDYSLQYKDIEKICAYVPERAYNLVGKKFTVRPSLQVDAQFSIPYTVSLALTNGEVRIEDFSPQQIMKGDVFDLAQKVEVFLDPNYRDGGTAPVRLEVWSKQGDNLSVFVEKPKGNPQNPMSINDCLNKFRMCLNYAKVSEEKSAEIIETVRNMENAIDIRSIACALRINS